MKGGRAAQRRSRSTLPPDLPIINGDHHQLCQVFTNLLTNAFEALGGAGQVTMTAIVAVVEREAAFASDLPTRTPVVIIDVTDDGPGVRADLIDRIFDPFFTTKPEGTGLGLSIVRKIVDAHDGRIDLSTMPDRGTRFRVTLPISAAVETGGFKQKGN